MARSSKRIATLKQVLALPTAPFAEREVIAFVRRFCDEHGIDPPKTDAAGNLLVRVRRGKPKTKHPICLTAHMDHPGFVVTGKATDGLTRAAWRGGVKPDYFPGARVRFWDDSRWIKAKIVSVRHKGKGPLRIVRDVTVDTNKPLPAGTIGMWDLPDPMVRGRRIHARACDDLAGLAGMLCCVAELQASRANMDAYFLFTRAEEVGFVGALAACRNRTIPARCVVVAVENSSEIPGVSMGDGPILRVGDKAQIFSPQVTSHCRFVADQLARHDKSFKFQRKLMDGGTCESTAYCHHGYDATGICIALGNYHNMDRAKKRIAAEYIHLDDFDNLVTWFVALCKLGGDLNASGDMMTKRLSGLETQYAALLARTKKGTGV